MYELPEDTRSNLIYQLSVRAKSYFDAKAYDSAIADYTSAILISHSTDASLFNNRANVYMELEDFQNAIMDLNRAITLKPCVAVSYYNRAAVYMVLKKIDSAIIDITIALRLNPHNPDFRMLAIKLETMKLLSQSKSQKPQVIPVNDPINLVSHQERLHQTTKRCYTEYTEVIPENAIGLEPLFSEITSYYSSDSNVDTKAQHKLHASYFQRQCQNPVAKIEDTKRKKSSNNTANISSAPTTYGSFFSAQTKNGYQFIGVPNLEHKTTGTCKLT